jgi:hypothetical protein
MSNLRNQQETINWSAKNVLYQKKNTAYWNLMTDEFNDSILVHFKYLKIFDELIEFFESWEEYEKCAVLSKRLNFWKELFLKYGNNEELLYVPFHCR